MQKRLLNPTRDYNPVSPELRERCLVKYIYLRHKNDIDLKRSIVRFLVYPRGYEYVQDMCVTLFSGRGIGGSWTNIRPHGNSKNLEQYLGGVDPLAKRMVFEFFDQNFTCTQVLSQMQAQPDPLKITRDYRIRYLYKKWKEQKQICCTSNPSQKLAHLVESMKNDHPKLVRAVCQSADGNPVVVICPEWVQLLMVNACGIRTRKLKLWTPSDLDVGK